MTEIPAEIAERLVRCPHALEEVETPAVVIDLAVVERNLARWQARCDAAGLANRPHIKTHRSAAIARRQVALGAKGITCQTLGEAEVMADAGIGDILITYNMIGRAKLARLAALAARVRLTVVADGAAVVAGLSAAATAAGATIRVLVECDTGGGRCGVQDPAAAVALAKVVDAAPWLAFAGLMTYPPPGGRLRSAEYLAAAVEGCAAAGLDAAVVSTGGSPDMWKDEGLGSVTEYRAGTYVYNDRSLAMRRTATFGDCALTVLATVVSRPTAGRAILDAGTKALTSDLLGLEGHGFVAALPAAKLYRLDEEHGYLDLGGDGEGPAVGDRLAVVPNHACVVSNLVDRIHVVADGRLLGLLPVDARGRSQ